MNLESRMKMGDEGSGRSTILSTRLLIHSVSSVLHYGSLWGIR